MDGGTGGFVGSNQSSGVRGKQLFLFISSILLTDYAIANVTRVYRYNTLSLYLVCHSGF